MTRYGGFAQVEYEHVRSRVYPSFDWTTFAEPSPRQRLERPLEQARVALVATAGAHLPQQLPFELGRAGDSSYREIPSAAREIRFAHVGYDTRGAERDADVVFPLALLRRLAAEGAIGAVAERAFSFMGYVPEPAPLLNEFGPEVARKLGSDGADLVLLVPSGPVCQQSVGLLQRVFDDHGLATVSLTHVREITELVKPSLACLVEHPFAWGALIDLPCKSVNRVARLI